MSQIALLAGSLVAVLALAGIARMLGLGGGGIASTEEACAHAAAMLSGFDPVRATLGQDGRAAVVEGTDGSVAILKLHGAQVAARRVYPPLATRPGAGGVIVDTGDRRFGSIVLAGVDAI